MWPPTGASERPPLSGDPAAHGSVLIATIRIDPEVQPRMSTSRVATWRFILETASVPVGTDVAALDWVSKWLLITRSGVFIMTLLSGLIGALLAVGVDPAAVNYWFAALAVVGIVIAHAANNMINDYFDLESGVDTAEYVRAQYAPHPILSGMVSKRTLATAILMANLVDLGIMVYLTVERGWPVVAFALGGAFISLFYVAPPIRLKHHGLGEPGVFIVWGPLMIGGTYFIATGGIPGWVWIATIPYAILVTTVLLGKHIDKIEPDREKGIHTLPVIIGERPAKLLTMGMMVAFYPILLGLVLAGLLGPWVLVVVLALPRLAFVLGIFRKPRPEAPPPDYPIWPLWFVGAAMIHTRLAGSFLVLGLIVNIILPVTLPWLA